MKLEINKKVGKSTRMWGKKKLDFLEWPVGKMGTQKRNQNISKQMKIKTNTSKPTRCYESSSKRGVCSDKYISMNT